MIAVDVPALGGWDGAPEPSSALHRLMQCGGERRLPFLKVPSFPGFCVAVATAQHFIASQTLG